MVSVSENPLLQIATPIPWSEIRPAHVVPAVTELLARTRAALDAIRTAPLSWDGVPGALDLATLGLDHAMGLASNLESVMNDAAIREAYGAVQGPTSELYASILTDAALFARMKTYAMTDEARSLDGPRRRYLDKTLADFCRNGAELDARGKEELTAIDVELTKITLQFGEHVLDATNAFELLVPEERLRGLPPGALAQAVASARTKGKTGARLTLSAPSYLPVMMYVADRGIREAMYRANVTRASRENAPLVSRILSLRQRKGRLLGFASFAELVLDDRMARSPADAMGFVRRLEVALGDAYRRENEELLAFVGSSPGGEDLGSLEPWDIAYFSERLRRDRYALDEETLRPYFPLHRVQEGLFSIARALFGVTIDRAHDGSVWHPDVTAWTVRDASGARLGSFYLDLFPREAKKDGAWMAGLVDRLHGTPRERENVALIVANLTPPVNGRPALLTHREVETLFHEFGHMMHHVLSDVPVRSLSGTRVLADFVELPSKIMENWCWEPDALRLFAAHHETGEPIPSSLVDRMQRARTFRAANAMMRQLGFSTVDLLLHTTFDPEQGDVLAFAREAFQRFSPTVLPEDYAMIASFSHLFGGAYGYAAGYYSYQWAEYLDADAYTEFAARGVLDGATGARFRDEILARGDGEDPRVLYRRFLGREPKVDAMLARLGVPATRC